jgi:hypothetical protein
MPTRKLVYTTRTYFLEFYCTLAFHTLCTIGGATNYPITVNQRSLQWQCLSLSLILHPIHALPGMRTMPGNLQRIAGFVIHAYKYRVSSVGCFVNVPYLPIRFHARARRLLSCRLIQMIGWGVPTHGVCHRWMCTRTTPS